MILFKNKYRTKPSKYGIPQAVNMVLLKGQKLKREGKYEEAISLFKLANLACIDEFGVEDENCLYHIEQLENRKSMGGENFLRYMKSIAGNLDYEFPCKNK